MQPRVRACRRLPDLCHSLIDHAFVSGQRNVALRIKVDPINRDIELMLDQSFSPKAQAAALAGFAREQIEDAKAANKNILGRVPRYTVSVDGRIGGALEQVRPDGTIVAEFELVNDVLAWIGEQLVLHSPVKSGRYSRSHTLFADGTEIDVGKVIPSASEYTFLNSQPYAHKIETGSSSQAPDGVYQAVAILARGKFGNIAKISFSYRAPFRGSFLSARQGGNKSENRQPAIIVKLGDR